MKIELPGWTSSFRYLVLIGDVILIPSFFGSENPLFICSFRPVGDIEGAVPNMARQYFTGETVTWPNALKIAVVIAVLAAIFVHGRPWCRILCPLGIVFSLFNRVSVFFLGIDSGKCSGCKSCRNYCKQGLNPKLN